MIYKTRILVLRSAFDRGALGKLKLATKLDKNSEGVSWTPKMIPKVPEEVRWVMLKEATKYHFNLYCTQLFIAIYFSLRFELSLRFIIH